MFIFYVKFEELIIQYPSTERPKGDGQASINSHQSHHIYINRGVFTMNVSTS